MKERTVSTREFLRNFKAWKEMLISGKLMHIVIRLGDGETLKVERERKGLMGKELVKRIRSLKNPIVIDRPQNLFDELIPHNKRNHGS